MSSHLLLAVLVVTHRRVPHTRALEFDNDLRNHCVAQLLHHRQYARFEEDLRNCKHVI